MKATELLKDLRGASVEDLRSKLVDMRREQMTLRMQLSTGQLAQNDQIRKLRRDVARVKTILNQKVKAAAGNQGDVA